jgi:UDP-GlcNAc:undecaprenyl-phosphate GlcNAc-1-phosphate transferase
LILAVVSSFFIGAIGSLQAASRLNWRVRSIGPRTVERRPMRFVLSMRHPQMLPILSYLAIAASVVTYATLIVLNNVTPTNDVRLFILGLLVATVAFLLLFRRSQLKVVERAVIYVTATVLVYLDALVPTTSHVMSVVSWVAISVAALATALRLRLFNDRGFQVTPLDLIVLFMALVVPNLPGVINLPQGGTLAIAKLVVLFYALEMLMSRAETRPAWMRLGAAGVLTGLVLRAFILL